MTSKASLILNSKILQKLCKMDQQLINSIYETYGNGFFLKFNFNNFQRYTNFKLKIYQNVSDYFQHCKEFNNF